MVIKNSSVNLSITPNATGYTIGGGTTTLRNLTVSGASDLTINQSGATATTYTLPSALAADQVVVATNFNAVGTLLYGSTASAAGTGAPTQLAVGSQGQVLTVGASSALTWASPQSVTWTGVSTATACLQNTFYYVTSGTVAFTLPTTAAAGSLLSMSVGKGTAFTVAQGAGQSIQFGNVSSTLGATGSLSSTSNGDTINLVCVVPNTTWCVVSCMGNINVF